MNVTREEKMAEAIERMKALRVFKPTIKQFKDDGAISASVSRPSARSTGQRVMT